ncbi:hypothetical protein CYLTODRAFT_494985 [Cylindrobasidium torrendii FP15055 ss-10]|uniref:Uncharacterized protein n=1 Tax=Cylindrobasidium torrendii FP15055 ss-10 TaxID=1314674 RepID=A0A0D7AU44_9AGAR|nr:hypothetical protein CYLTODRAFT_494985 [Cylindrobasidium torrendii FP15055 ss-10]
MPAERANKAISRKRQSRQPPTPQPFEESLPTPRSVPQPLNHPVSASFHRRVFAALDANGHKRIATEVELGTANNYLASRATSPNKSLTWSKRPRTRNQLSPTTVTMLLTDAEIPHLLPTIQSIGVQNGEDLIFLAVEVRDRQFRQSLRAGLRLELHSYEWQSLLQCIWAFARPAGVEEGCPNDIN